MAYETIEYTVEDPVATIRLNRPERLNALSYELLRELRSAVEAAAEDPEVVGIVITGNGRAFCAGLDMEALVAVTSGEGGGRDGSAAAEGRAEDEVPGLFTYLYSVPKPVIAAVNGATAGGGLVLAAMCDLRFASPQAMFVSVFTQRGLVSEHGTTWILPRLMGAGRALDVLWSSRRVGGEEAARIGLVEHLVPEGADLVGAAQEYVRQLAATVSPASLADTKALVYGHLGEHYATALREIDEYQWRALDRPDSKEGVASFLERRPPRFPRIGG